MEATALIAVNAVDDLSALLCYVFLARRGCCGRLCVVVSAGLIVSAVCSPGQLLKNDTMEGLLEKGACIYETVNEVPPRFSFLF